MSEQQFTDFFDPEIQKIVSEDGCSIYRMKNVTGEGVITRYEILPGIELLTLVENFVKLSGSSCIFITHMSLPDGYGTVIGEGGATLSGGEKQRISIARAILKDAPIIILDEATSSVDPENENLLMGAIAELTKNKTVIMIAHRLKTVRNADQIFVLSGGHIVQTGKHEDLIRQPGIYADFIGIRKKAIGWKLK